MPDDIGAVNVRSPWTLDRNLHSAPLEALIIAAGEAAPLRVPSVEMMQLDTEEGCLELVQTAVKASNVMLKAPSISVVAQQANMLSVIGRAGDDHAAVAVAAEVFRRVEAEATEQAEDPYFLTLVRGAMRLTGVLDDFEPSVGSNREQ